ncbi:MAG: endo-1,4-beta-xylanase [Phycisphaeraceae bacterium]
MRELADKNGLLIGCAVATDPLGAMMRDGPTPYSTVLAEQFNIITAENATKFGHLSTGPGAYDWSLADALFDFAQRHRMQMRFHTGLWHNQLPTWLDESKHRSNEIAAIARDHLAAVGRRYGDRMYCWDVVNEPISDKPDQPGADSGPLRDTIWKRALGDDYLATVHHWAHEAAPHAKLVLNDYGTDIAGAKTDALYAVVNDLLARSVPLHAVGFQMHLLHGQRYDPSAVTANFQRFADLGVEIHITEMDVAIAPMSGDRQSRLKQQAQAYRDVLAAAMKVKGFTVFQTWGFTDRHSWVPKFTKCDDAALPLDENLLPKPAYFALREALQQAGQSHMPFPVPLPSDPGGRG